MQGKFFVSVVFFRAKACLVQKEAEPKERECKIGQ